MQPSQSTAEADQAWPQGLRRVGRILLRLPRTIAWVLPLSWAALIFALSGYSQPLDGLPESVFISLLGNLFHALEFGVLLLFMVPLLPRAGDWVVWSGAASKLLPSLAFLYAVSDEVHQSRVPGRDASLLDLCTDLAGILSVYWVVRSLEDGELSTRNLKVLLGRAVLVCCICAGAATLWGALYEAGPWL